MSLQHLLFQELEGNVYWDISLDNIFENEMISDKIETVELGIKMSNNYLRADLIKEIKCIMTNNFDILDIGHRHGGTSYIDFIQQNELPKNNYSIKNIKRFKLFYFSEQIEKISF